VLVEHQMIFHTNEDLNVIFFNQFKVIFINQFNVTTSLQFHEMIQPVFHCNYLLVIIKFKFTMSNFNKLLNPKSNIFFFINALRYY
jgi:hypothetical protein